MNKTSDSLLLVTGATGNTGAPAARLLLQRGHRVRTFVHREDARSESLAAAGADIVAGDMLDFHAVSAALRGVTAAYFVYPIAPGLLEATAMFAQAASEAGVEAVVNMSQISARREARSNAARHHWLAERLLDRTTMRTTHLRPTFFAEWLSWFWTRRGDEGLLKLPFGNGRHAPIAAEDQAHVIAAILENPDPHDRQIYPLHGPIEMNHYEIADAMSRGPRHPCPLRTGGTGRLCGCPDRERTPIPSRPARARCRRRLPERNLRWDEQPRRGHRRQDPDERRGLRERAKGSLRQRRPPGSRPCVVILSGPGGR